MYNNHSDINYYWTTIRAYHVRRCTPHARLLADHHNEPVNRHRTTVLTNTVMRPEYS
jgi:hypothetical protein